MTWVLAAHARASLPTRAHAWETDRQRHTTHTQHNTSLGRPSARRRVDSNSDNRHRVFQLVFCLLWMDYTYYMSVLHMLCIYMEIAINGIRGLALYAPILRIWVIADLQIRAKLEIFGATSTCWLKCLIFNCFQHALIKFMWWYTHMVLASPSLCLWPW